MAVLSACFVIYKHKDNLKRIFNRTEAQFSFSKISKKKLAEGEQQASEGKSKPAPSGKHTGNTQNNSKATPDSDRDGGAEDGQ